MSWAGKFLAILSGKPIFLTIQDSIQAEEGLRTMEKAKTGDMPLLVKPGKNRTNFWTRRKETPTYEVVGKLERADPRDNVTTRTALVPGTDKYTTYYQEHPEMEEKDKKLRISSTAEVREKRREELFGNEPLALALSNACRVANLLENTNFGAVSKKRIELDPEFAAQNIKGAARYLGADLAGICELNQAWVYSHYPNDGHGSKWGEPVCLNHRYAIALAGKHNFEMLLAGRGIGVTAAIETSDVAFTKIAVSGVRLTSYIRALGYQAETHMAGGKVNAVAVAVDAGLGEVGRGGLLITREYGPAVRLNIITTDLPLAVDKPVDIGVQDFCARCFKCADTCSSGAIGRGDKEIIRGVKLWPVNNDLCFLARATRGREPVCFNCMSTCPWTKPKNFIHQSAGWLAARFFLARSILIWLDDVLYGKKPRPHPFPDWLEWDRQKLNWKERLSIFLHKI